MKKLLLVLGSMMLAASPLFAQETTYQRSSLHMVLLTTDEPMCPEKDVEKYVSAAWNNYPMPDKYNDHSISFKEAKAGKPKGSIISIVTKYSDPNALPKDLPGMMELLNDLKGGKKYREQLEEKVKGYVESEKLAHQMLAKWFNVKEDGTCDLNLLTERCAFNMNSSDVTAAAATAGGADALVKANAGELLNTTFITFSKLDFYKNEAMARLIHDLTVSIARQQIPNELAVKAAILAADKAYDLTKDGYTAKTTTMLYKLKWNDSVEAVFYDLWKDATHIDMKKFYETPFELEYVGYDDCSSTVMFSLNKSVEELVNTTVIRNIDKQFVNLQKKYEVFKPVAPIICADPLLVDIGMKEGLTGGEKFEILQKVQDPKTGKLVYKGAGIIKVDKKGVWDNRYDMTDGKAQVTDSPVKTSDGKNGTLFSKNKKAMVGMVVRQVK